ncbi:MAG TPA: ATPase, T2SS/T4P/T4SS family [Candidatus Omnitrophota bacterium]|nr:ATPase, T2SS/T4P/T4SS family [Candidatus Omnitrophota bacterium]
MAHQKLGEILIQQGLISEEQLKDAISRQKRERGRLGEILVKMGTLTEDDIIAALGTQLNLPYANKDNNLLKPNTSQGLDKLVPHDFAKTNLVLPITKKGHVLTCAVTDPLDLMMLDNLKMITGCEINLIIATHSSLVAAIQDFYTIIRSHAAQGPLDQTDHEKKEDGTGEQKKDSSKATDLDKLIEKAEEAPVIKLVDLIIKQAIEQRSSDIHIEPFKERINLRYRIDGALYQIPPPSRSLHSAIVSRLKILSRLDIAEKRLPQDGAISFKHNDRVVDIRVSTIPTVWGEKVVMRILDKEAVKLELSNLGFDPTQLENIKKSLKRPYGLFFVTGPTGSGKSTTLYSALSETIDPRKNIMTAEDPVEFKLEGINQVQVKPDIGLTFASALRSFLRQDPDVIMVGEVRDLETAQICVRAALTGHFVLSTLHTNDAASAITRLLDIGIESYLLTPSLICIVAQRLARRLCSKCKEPVEPNPDLFGGISFKSDLIYKAKGCEECNHTGYHGRIILTETMLIDDAIRELISKEATYIKILDAARKNGMDTLFDDGIKKVEAGITSFDEIVSVTSST